MTKKFTYILFWIRSSRGTDEVTVREYRAKVSKEQIKADLEEWCSRFGAWHVSENMVSYGYKTVRAETRDILLKRWNRLCKQKNALEKRWKELRAKLNPIPAKR